MSVKKMDKKRKQEVRRWWALIKGMNGSRKKQEKQQKANWKRLYQQWGATASLTLPSLPSPLFNKTSTCSNQYTPTHWDTMHTYRCARLGPTLHSAPSLAWMPEEKCGKMCHLSSHSSALTLFTPPSQPFAFHYEKKNQSFNLELHVRRYHTRYYRLFSQKLSCVGDLDCFTGQFTSPDCSMTYSIRPHIWRSDGKQIVIFALQTFLGGKSFVWNQDAFQWKDPRKRNLIFWLSFL